MTSALVQEMVPGGVELIVGGTYDASFGPLVLYGTGGTLVELFSDVSFRMPPLTEQDAADMIAETKGATLLRGFRGAPPADETALRDLLFRVSALLETCPEVQEMDLNPVKALARGVRVVDVRVRVGKRPDPPRARRVVY
jgi:acyl-CoA synthetase (NDP forming)